MTTTDLYSGLQSDKNSSRVLRPPGGGSSNIFGAPDPAPAQQKSKNYTKSNVFGGSDDSSVATAKPAASGNQAQTKDRLFGDTPSKSAPAPKAKQDNHDRIFGQEPPKAQGGARQQGGFNPITHDAPADPQGNAHTSTRVRQPPGGASSKLW